MQEEIHALAQFSISGQLKIPYAHYITSSQQPQSQISQVSHKLFTLKSHPSKHTTFEDRTGHP